VWFFVIFLTFSLYVGNRKSYKEVAGNVLRSRLLLYILVLQQPTRSSIKETTKKR
jgi:hypothetical protein